MKKNIFIILVALLSTSLVAADHIRPSREQTQLRTLFKQATATYLQLSEQIKDKFLPERSRNSVKERVSEFYNAAQQVELIEGVIFPPASSNGKSRIWETRTRVKSYEVSHATKNYYGGPESDVILFNGEFVQSTIDISYPSRGNIGFSLRRFYNSQTDYHGPMGNGWDFSYNAHLVLDNSSHQQAKEATLYLNGQAYKFVHKGKIWESSSGNFFRLTSENDKFYIYDSQLSRMEFERSAENMMGWRLSALASRHSNFSVNRIVIQYQKDFDRIDYIEEPYGNKTIFSYNEDGKIIQATSPHNAVQYFYNPSGMLEKVSFAKSALSFSESVAFEIKYTYELVSERYLLTSRNVNNSKSWYSVSYDSQGRVVNLGYKSTEQDATWRFQWDKGQTLTITPAAPATTINLTFTSPDAFDLPSEISIPALKSTEKFSYNRDGLLTSYIDAVGVRKTFEYDTRNSLPELRSNLLKTIKFPAATSNQPHLKNVSEHLSYVSGKAFLEKKIISETDTEGKTSVLKTQEYEYSPDFEITSFNDNGIVTRYLSNKFGETAVTLDANNRATINYYSKVWPQKYVLDFTPGQVSQGGLLVAVVSDATKKQLDEACEELETEPFLFNDILRVQPISLTSYFAYDKQGKTIHSRSGENESFAVYNRHGNTLASLQPRSGISFISYSPQFKRQNVFHQFAAEGVPGFPGRTHALFKGHFFMESLIYNDHNQVVSVRKTDELVGGKSVIFNYTRYPDGKIKNITDPCGISRVDEYSANGLIFSQFIQNGNDVTVLNKDFQYFPNGQIQSCTNLFGEEIKNSLDEFGRLTGCTNALGIKTLKILDGLDRVTEEISSKAGKIISRKTYIYGENGLLKRQYEYRITGEITEKVLTKELLYDVAGNVIASRGVQDNSWEYFLHDGLNRIVTHKNPVGDLSFSIYDNDLLAMSLQADLQENRQYRWQGKLNVYDAAGNHAVTIPTDTENTLLLHKLVYTQYDFVGNQLSMIRPELNSEEKRYNTLKQIVSEKTIPSSQSFGEQSSIIQYSYLPNGRLASKTVDNSAMVLFGPKDNVEASTLSAPQKTSYFYDKLGREATIVQPDGLMVEKRYNDNSMPVEMIWRHATDEQTVLRHLCFKFGKLGRLQAITDTKSGKVLRHYIYDDYGNRTEEHDGSVVIFRNFDSLGMLLSERVKIGDKTLPEFTKEYTLANGTEILRWGNLPKLAPSNWKNEMIYRDAAGRVVAIRLNDSQNNFVTWKYVGLLPTERYIPESQIVQRNTFSNCNELDKTTFFENSQIYGDLDYSYDKHGNQIFSSTNLARQTASPYTYAQYTEYNTFQQVVAQNGEIPLPSKDTALERRGQVLGGQSLQSKKTTRMVFDQVDNIWAQYHGERISHLTVKNFTQSNLSSFMSAARTLPSFTNVSQADLYALASNRETTRASFSSDGKLTTEENIYDKLGNLIQFKGMFWNGERSMNVIWHLTFDELGRLVYMKGIIDEDKFRIGFLHNGDLAAELFFYYDAENRRIQKTVKDYSRFKTVIEKIEWTVYVGNNQAIVLKNNGMQNIFGQYLWKPDSRELLMAALPQNIAENDGSFAPCRYYFQQDRGLNTICVTKTENGNPILVSGASYLCFGKNATAAKIKNIESSMPDTNRSNAMNNMLDDTENAVWKNSSSKPQFIEIRLTERANLSSLKIWTDESFPKDFLIFVLPSNAESPNISDDLNTWATRMAKQLVYQHHSDTAVKKGEPLSIPLYCLSGDRIVVLWNKHEGKDVHVAEFEVGITPDTPGAIAFAGQWLDRETDMYYQINRYKLAGANRFISPDPIGFLDGNNLYAYAKNNPLNWHDPNGEWVHILLGALAGAGINSGVYAIQCWITEEDFSWKELAIRAGTGALAGGVAAATFGAVNPLLAGWGLNATANIVVSAGAAGFAGGAASGTSNTLLHGGSVKDAAIDGLKTGGWGAAGGAISGGILSYTGASLGSTLFAGGASGGIVNGTQSALDAYAQTGDWSEAFWGGVDGAWKGAAFGTAVAGAGWGIGKVTGRIQKLEKYPEDLPDPRQGIMIKTKGPDRTYDGMQVRSGYARHHAKPLVLGGRDVQSNLEYVPEGIHRQAHPGPIVKAANYGTIFY